MTKRYKSDNWNSWDNLFETETYVEVEHKKLRRDKIDGVFGGVCSGLGNYFGIDHIIVRLIIVLSFFMTGGTTLLIYLLLWLFIPKDKRAPYRREYREARRARRKQREAPEEPLVRTASFRDVKSKFRSLETRLQDLERSITSKEWKLRRDFRDLEG